MRQSWYESAKKNMRQEERTAFYEACFEFEFYGIEPSRENCPFGNVLLLFDVVRDDLARDIEKADKIAERNRRNGLTGGRPKIQNPDETQKNPKNPSGYFGLPLHYNNTTYTIIHQDIEKYYNFFYLFLMFAKGCINPIEERERFINYYDARGWMIGKDIPASDKIALCKAWKPEKTDESLRQRRAKYAELLQAIDAEDDILITAWEGYAIEGEKHILTFTDRQAYEFLEHKYLRALQNIVQKVDENGIIHGQVEYRLPNHTKERLKKTNIDVKKQIDNITETIAHQISPH